MAPKQELSPLGQLIQLFLKAHAAKNFGAKEKWNEERWKEMQVDDWFLGDIEHLRRKWGVPFDLTPRSDISTPMDEDGNYGEDESDWVNGLGSAKAALFERDIRIVIAEHHLPSNFFTFIRYLLLYRKPPSANWHATWRTRWTSMVVGRLAE